MKKWIILITICLMMSGCSSNNNQNQEADENQTLSIVTTSFHEYDWLMQVLQERSEIFDIVLLMDTGVDLHSYEPSVEDITIISNADLFIYNGGPSHDWVDELLQQSGNENLNTIDVIKVLDDLIQNEVHIEGMQASSHDHEHEESHDHEHEESHDHEHEESHDHEESVGRIDEHVWLSLSNAQIIVDEIAIKMGNLDPEYATHYQENADSYNALLEELDASFHEAIEHADRDTLIFADRFPFLYLMDDYDIDYYAAFQGCSTDTEASFETIAFISDKISELEVNVVFVMDNGLIELANTVIANSNQEDVEVLELNSIQSVNQVQINDGITYYEIMENNLVQLKKALEE